MPPVRALPEIGQRPNEGPSPLIILNKPTAGRSPASHQTAEPLRSGSHRAAEPLPERLTSDGRAVAERLTSGGRAVAERLTSDGRAVADGSHRAAEP